MALDASLLYGLVAASAIAHAALVFAIYVFMNLAGATGSGILQGILCAISFVIQFGLLTALQANTCGGVKDYSSIIKGSVWSLLIVGIFTLIPVKIPYMRDIVAWLSPRATPADVEVGRILEQAAINIQSATSTSGATPAPPDVLSASLEAYQQDTFLATTKAIAFWAAFAGAYGIAAGSLVAAKCPATK